MTQDPQSLQLKAQAAMTAIAQGDGETAKTNFEQVLSAGHDQPEIWLGLALAHQVLKDDDGMIAALDRTLASDPQNIRALIMKGDAIWTRGEPQSAVTFYKRVLTLVPDVAALPPPARDAIRNIQARVDQYKGDMQKHLTQRFAENGLINTDKIPSRFQHALDLLYEIRERYEQQPRALYYPELPARQFYEPRDYAWTSSLLAAEAAIREEFLALKSNRNLFTPYIHATGNSPINPDHPLLDNEDWSAMHIVKNGVVDQEVARRMPTVLKALEGAPLERVAGRGPTILVSRLAPGSKIGAHTGYLNTRLTCHLPIVIPGQCGIRVGNETRHWRSGEMLMFNDSIDHEAWNDSAEERYVLIFFVWRPELPEAERNLVKHLLEGVDLYNPD